MNICGVYAITSPTGKRYIGSAVDVRKRWRVHRCLLRAGTHHCKPLQQAFVKYGEGSLRFEMLENTERDALLEREQHHIDAVPFARLYNILPQAGGTQGRVITNEMRKRLSSKLKGRKFSDETLARMRCAQKGRKQSSETVSKRAAALKGKQCSEVTRAKISASQRGRPRNESPNRSGFVGVYAVGDRWRAKCGRIYLGYHLTLEAAANAVAQFKLTGVANPLRTNNTSGFKGVVAKGNRWQATYRVNGQRVYVGSFTSPEAAYAAIQAISQ